jgi:hypothetical protein
MIKVFSPLPDGSCRADGHAGTARTAVFFRRRVDSKGKVRQDGQEANPCSVPLADQKVVPTDPSDPCGLSHVFMGEMPSLILPVDELRSGNGRGPISEILNGMGQDEPEGIEKNVDPLIVLKIERGRFVFNVIQDGIREVVPDRNRKGMPVHDPGGEKNLFFSKGPEISHAEEGNPPLAAKALKR